MRTLLLSMTLLMLPATARAQDAAEEVAAKASKAHTEHCAQAAGTGAESDAAQAISEVGAVWAEVARVHEATGASWLLYWRGLLAQCIGQDERAAEALVDFMESEPEADGMEAMALEARKRLRRLRPDYVPPQPPKAPKPPRVPPTPEERQRAGRGAGGIVLALGAVGAGFGSGVGFAQLSATRTAVAASLHTRAESDALIAQGDGQMVASVGLAVGAGVAAVASIAAFANRAAVGVEVAAMPVPLAGGLGLAVSGRW